MGPGLTKQISIQSLAALNCLVLLVSGLQAGVGPFFSYYLKADLHWDPNQIGFALGVVNFAALLNQILSGLLIDAFKIKRIILAASCLIFAISCFLISQTQYYLNIYGLQFIIGLSVAIIPQSIAAISLGLVGRREFPKRVSTNQALSHVSNIMLALLAGLFAYYSSNIWILYTYSIFSLLGIFPLIFINPKEINHDVARQLTIITTHQNRKKILPIDFILTSSINIIFLIAVFLFHFSSAAQLSLIGQLFANNNSKTGALFMAGSIIITHLIMIFVALFLRSFIQTIPRKPLILFAFLLVFIRGILYTFSHDSFFILTLQLFDGISAGIFGIVSIVTIFELAKDSGRFNFMLGLMTFCQGLAYAISNVGSGYIANLYGYNAGFYGLASAAIIGFIFFLLAMPETLNNVKINSED